MKKVIGILMILTIIIGLSGCSTIDSKQTEQQDKMLSIANDRLGLPSIDNFYEKKILKEIMEECDKSNLINYAYVQSQLTGKFVYLGKCMGYPIPYSTEYTNPEKYDQNGATLPQADPNGLFKPQGVAATWIIMVDPNTGKKHVQYCEPNVFVSPFKLEKWQLEKDSYPSNY